MEKFKFYSAFIFIFTLLSAGCANISDNTFTKKVEKNSLLARQASCELFYSSLDKAVSREDVMDVQTTQVIKYPFLSMNRFLLSFKNELASSEQKSFWLTEAAKLNRQKRKFEWSNLATSTKSFIKKKHLKSLSFEQRLKSCSNELLLRLDNNNISDIINTAEVKDDYSSNMRTLGLYPLTSIIVQKQIKKHHKTTRDTFNKELHQLPVKGELQRYVPDTNQATFNNLTDDTVNKENPLGIPFISSTTLNELFNQYAPTLEIDETGDYDKNGEIKLNDKNRAYIDTDSPAVYILPSYTRFAEKTLLQLNYFFWFPERPQQKDFDLYSGKFDGIIWRVTLDENLKPLLFDSVHNCGCYHKFYSTQNMKFNLEAALLEKEPPFLAQHNIAPEENTSWVLRINSVNHFIERIYQKNQFDKDAKSYSLQSYHQLRHLAVNKSTNKRKSESFFSDNGIVKSSKRLERFILWPMGIPSAGAMRQWGHHATAFVGKRYFDDSDLLDKYFTLEPDTN